MKDSIMNNSLDDKWFITLNIPGIEGGFLHGLNDFCRLLNGETHPFSFVNKEGAVTDGNHDGVFVVNNSGSLGLVLGHEFCPFIYRGQNKANPFGNTVEEESDVKSCIDWIKKNEFLQLFKTTSYVERCEKFKVSNIPFKFDLEAVALHYGFTSSYVELTRELIVALFLAYTYEDEKGKYQPVSDFDKYSPTLYVGNLSKINEQLSLMTPQILPRPIFRHAMALNPRGCGNLPTGFTAFDLPKNPAVALYIFHELHGSKGLFPPFDFLGLAATQVKTGKLLYRKYFQEFCTQNVINEEELKLKLHEKGYDLTDSPWAMSSGHLHHIDINIDQLAEYLKKKVGFRTWSPSKPNGFL